MAGTQAPRKCYCGEVGSSCPYLKIRPLGEGAVGDVYLCIGREDRRLAVVKWLQAEIHESSEAARRFLREAELLSSMWFEQGMIQVARFGVDDYGKTWMAMEFVDGLAPSVVISPGDGWSLHRLLEGVGRSLDEMHGLGVVHGNLKPDNILVRDGHSGWEPVVIDLGIAKWLPEEVMMATGSVVDASHYRSPEQGRDLKSVGPASDRYALAVVCFELLSGRLPFAASTHSEVLRQPMTIPPLSIPARGPLVEREAARTTEGDSMRLATPRLNRFMRRALARRPDDRFSSVEVLSEQFRAAAMADGLWEERVLGKLYDPIFHSIVEISATAGAKRFDLSSGPIVLGRHDACHYSLSSPRLSRMHALLYIHRGRLWFADLHSQNGSSCYGRKLTPGVPVPLPTDGTPVSARLYDRDVVIRTFRS